MNDQKNVSEFSPDWPQLGLLQRPADQVILHSPDRPMSVGQFTAAVASFACLLPEKKYVINLHSDRHKFLISFCASILRGQCTLMPPNRQPETLAGLKLDYPDCYVLGDEADKLQPTRISVPLGGSRRLPDIPPDQVCAIAFTSGSTGKSNAFIKTWRQLSESTHASIDALLQEWTGPAHLLATVPAQHMWGFETSILIPLFSNLAISSAQPLYPQDIVSALLALPAPRMLVSSPLHLQSLVRSGLEVPPLSRIFTATAPLSQTLAQELESHLCAPVVDVFGSSETGIIASRRTALESSWKLCTPYTLEVTQGKAMVSASHFPQPIALADCVEPEVGKRFKWLARENDQVNVAGKRASLAELNRRLLAIDGVRDGVIFLPSHQLRLAAVIVAPGLNTADIRKALLSHIDPAFLPRPMVFVSELPRNETGKIPLATLQQVLDRARQGHRSQRATPDQQEKC